MAAWRPSWIFDQHEFKFGQIVVNWPMTHMENVFDIHKVPELVSVGVVVSVASEELHRLGLANLSESVKDNRRHARLVVLPRSIDIEELESSPEIGCATCLCLL